MVWRGVSCLWTPGRGGHPTGPQEPPKTHKPHTATVLRTRPQSSPRGTGPRRPSPTGLTSRSPQGVRLWYGTGSPPRGVSSGRVQTPGPWRGPTSTLPRGMGFRSRGRVGHRIGRGKRVSVIIMSRKTTLTVSESDWNPVYAYTTECTDSLECRRIPSAPGPRPCRDSPCGGTGDQDERTTSR